MPRRLGPTAATAPAGLLASSASRSRTACSAAAGATCALVVVGVAEAVELGADATGAAGVERENAYAAPATSTTAPPPSARSTGCASSAASRPTLAGAPAATARVSTHHSLISGLPEHQWPQQSGVIIEDYSDLIENTANAYGRSWAITPRYAIALDNGCLSPATPAHSTPNT